jgi:FolB domain-containing protein
MRDRIRVDGLVVECAVGIYPHERRSLQPVVADIELELDTQRAALEERLAATVDYASICAQATFVLEHARFRLLETAAHVLARLFLLPGEHAASAVQHVCIKLSKPGALAGNAVPSVAIEREAAWVQAERIEQPFGYVDVVHRTRDAGLYRLALAPDGALSAGELGRFGSHALPLGAGVSAVDGGLRNRSSRQATALCIGPLV